jgi:predicted ester cyclase
MMRLKIDMMLMPPLRDFIDLAIKFFQWTKYVMVNNQWGELLSGMFKGFPDFTIDIVKTHNSDDAVILEVRMYGTHLGDWAGLKPTGRLMDIPVACIFEFEADRLVCEKV